MSTYQSQYTGVQIDEAVAKALNIKDIQAVTISIPSSVNLNLGYTAYLNDSQITTLKDRSENYLVIQFGATEFILQRVTYSSADVAVFQSTVPAADQSKLYFAFAQVEFTDKRITFIMLDECRDAKDIAQEALTAASRLPAVTASDNGKFLAVIDGNWAATELPRYDGSVTVE